MHFKHPRLQWLHEQLLLEQDAQNERFQLRGNLKELAREGVLIQHFRVVNKRFGFADYPEFTATVSPHQNTDGFRDGGYVELFCADEAKVQGMILSNDGRKFECRVFAPDFPDWLEDKQAAIHVVPDTKTHDCAVETLKRLEKDEFLSTNPFFNFIHHGKTVETAPSFEALPWFNKGLNESQQAAVQAILSEEPLSLVHGPPGTGKTTTVCEAIQQLSAHKQKSLVCATGNAAVDHIALELVKRGVKVLRVGNLGKIHADLLPFTVEGKMNVGPEQQQIKKMHVQAAQYRKMANQYKRNFGKDERDQRKLLIQEVKNIRSEIKKLVQYCTEKWMSEADVICGTPVALFDLNARVFDASTLFIDEAGQCLETLAWMAYKPVSKVVLAGDHLQLPPTILSEKAIRNGYNVSILELALHSGSSINLLDTQYRMRESIAAYSNVYFYESKLKTPDFLKDTSTHLYFYDTVGTGFTEEVGEEGSSLQNTGELRLAHQLILQNSGKKIAFISPYASQVAAAKEQFPDSVRCATVDSFQGQESEVVIISLVRSNEEQNIGFLKDYRRMNVAMTRAKETLYVIGDSLTIGNDAFFQGFIEFTEKNASYFSAWELLTD
jgi:superfamily I DNA and/or RNA helicase